MAGGGTAAVRGSDGCCTGSGATPVGADPVVGAVRDAALVPTQSALFGLERWWQGHVDGPVPGAAPGARERRLQAEVEALRAENTDLLAAQAENDRLRQALRLSAAFSPRPLAAEVIALKPTPQTDTLILNRGRLPASVPRRSCCRPTGRWSGRCWMCSAHSCTCPAADGLRQLRRGRGDPAREDGRKGAPRDRHLPGRPGRPSILTFPRIDADVRPGDRVVTSGLGTVFPKGLPLGTVASVSTDKTRSVKTATVRPAADFDHLEEAFLAP